MRVFARVDGGIVVDLTQVASGQDLDRLYHPDLVAALVPVPADVTVEAGHSWDGEQFSPPPAPPELVPGIVSKLQLVRALRHMVLKELFDGALAGADEETREDWSLAVEIRRDDPLVATFAAALSVPDEAVDELFRLAATL